MQGILCINKEQNMTSFDVVRKLHQKTRLKVGHTGTLDPMATGVLVCLVNNTKVLSFMDMKYKTYRAKCKLGYQTDTLDIWGKTLKTQNVHPVSQDKLINVLDSFLGISKQTVPMVSAKKIAGKKLYEYQRQDIKIEQPIREIEIKDMQLIKFQEDEIEFITTVSSGTYIRSLCQDIAEKLGNLGCMSELCRLKAGSFKLSDCHYLDEVLQDVEKYLMDIRCGLSHYPQVIIENPTLIFHGKSINLDYQGNEILGIYDDKALAILEFNESENSYRVKRGLWL